MSVIGGPGQGLTLALDVDTTLSRLDSVQLPSWVTEQVDFTGLSELDWFQFIGATLQNGGEFRSEHFFNTEIAVPTLRVVQVATITFAKQTPANATGGILSGTGFLTEVGWPNADTGQPLMQSLAFAFDGGAGGTVPTWVPEAA